MPLNPTLNYLLEKISVSVMSFSKAITTSSMYLAGAGGCAGDGFPLPVGGTILGIEVYDGSHTEEKTGSITVNAGDRISVYAENSASTFIVTVRVNGSPTSLSVSEMDENTDMYACVYLNLQQS